MRPTLVTLSLGVRLTKTFDMTKSKSTFELNVVFSFGYICMNKKLLYRFFYSHWNCLQRFFSGFRINILAPGLGSTVKSCLIGMTSWRHDVMTSAMAFQITGVSIVCSTVCSGVDQRKYQSSTAVALVTGIHRWPVDSPQRASSGKMFSFDDVIMVFSVLEENQFAV